MVKCASNKFDSQCVYIDDKCYNIDDYRYNFEIFDKKKLRCKNGHKLIYIRGDKNNYYFKHKNSNDIKEKDSWYFKWKNKFIILDKMKNNSKTDKSFNIIKIQDNEIEEKDVLKKENYYRNKNKKLIWLLNGNQNISINESDMEPYYTKTSIEFKKDLWRFKNFKKCQNVYLNIKNFIYKIEPNLIENNIFITNKKPLSDNDFINFIKNNNYSVNKIKNQSCNII